MLNNCATLIRNFKPGEALYLLFFSMMMAVKMAGFYEGQWLFNLALVVGCILLAIKILIDENTVREYAIIAIVILLAVLVYLNTGEKGLILCFAMMIGMKGVSTRKVFVCGTVISVPIVFFKILTRVFGFLPEVYFVAYRVGRGTELRHSLGYAHPNTLQVSVLIMSMMVLYLLTKHTRHVLLGSLVVLVFNVYIFKYSGSRTGMLVCFIYVVVNLCFFYIPKFGFITRILCYAIYPGACLISLVLPVVLPERLFTLLDERVFTYRLSFARYYYNYNKVSLFGIRLANPQKIRYSIDMAYLYLFLQLGLVAFIVISIITMICVHKAILVGKYAELAMFISITAAGMFEPFLYNSSFKNLLFVFAGVVLFDQLQDEHSKEGQCGLNQLLKVSISAVLAASICLATFLALTDPPTSIYVDVEPPIINKDVDVTPYYFSRTEKEEIVGQGALVFGYDDEKEPLYKLDVNLAYMEYKNRMYSVFVLGAILGYVLFYVIEHAYSYLCRRKANSL